MVDGFFPQAIGNMDFFLKNWFSSSTQIFKDSIVIGKILTRNSESPVIALTSTKDVKMEHFYLKGTSEATLALWVRK